MWWFNRNTGARKHSRRRVNVTGSDRLESLEIRQVLSAVAGGANQYDGSQFLVQFRDEAAIRPIAGTAIGGAVEGLPGWYTVNLQSSQSVGEARAAYQADSNVAAAQFNYQFELAATPNDTNFSSLWGMTRINAPQAWDRTVGSRSIVVAVIDTGVDYNHPDLAANIWRNTREIAGNGIDDDGNGFRDDTRGWDFANNDNNPMDDQGHGTHVAGTIGAVGNNRQGVTGVAWNVQIMPLKFLTATGGGTTLNAVRAINYAVANGARILNNSWGGGGFDMALNNAIANARSRGVIFVAAAGNESNNNDSRPTYPANYNHDNVVSVAATDSADRLANFSNFGRSTVDIAAPGVNILSTARGGGYVSMSGTSMAAPHVAGAAALVWSQNPSMSYSQVINALYSSSDVISGLTTTVAGGRRLNVGRAVTPVTRDVTREYNWSGSMSINDNTTNTYRFNIAENVRIDDIDIRLNLTHTYVGDLIISLTSPSGRSATLFNRRGGSGDNLSNTRFNDEAGTFIGNGAAPFAGQFRGENWLSTFDGLGSQGVWTVTIRDAAARDVGALRGIGFIMTTRTTIYGAALSSSSQTIAGLSTGNGPVAGSQSTPTVTLLAASSTPVVSGLTNTSNGSTNVVSGNQTAAGETETPRRLPMITPLASQVTSTDAVFANFSKLLTSQGL
jgi:subtilisin family serine protease